MNLVPDCRKNKHSYSLLVDLAKAYDSVDRVKMMGLLETRCRGDDEKRIVSLIKQLHMRATLVIESEIVHTWTGVAQSSVLAPLMFSVYLEEVLMSQPTLARVLRRGDLAVYIDDIACRL